MNGVLDASINISITIPNFKQAYLWKKQAVFPTGHSTVVSVNRHITLLKDIRCVYTP